MNESHHALLDNIKFQFDISKKLLEYHLSSLSQEEYLWRSPNCGLYIQERNGKWYADFPKKETYDIGTPSIAWTLWHITFWWEMVFNHSFGDGTLTKEQINVYKDVESVKLNIYSLVERWQKTLSNLAEEELYSKYYSKFPFNNEVEFHKLASWLNLELMKNASEIGYVRFEYASFLNRENKR
ncbi:DinB family protein [Tetragenococcus solitarius]|uniref:DinB family protein n=1 Tax=Tetragenococcus solitarius TaxID=71453 RepID=A0ABN3XYQ9_9ENTE|nr:DinB family protein [Tetragenococcus solitarius]